MIGCHISTGIAIGLISAVFLIQVFFHLAFIWPIDFVSLSLVPYLALVGSVSLNADSVSLCKYTPQLVNWFSGSVCFYFIMNLFIELFRPYRNVPKFQDRQVRTNSVDPDQTAPS